jgi:phosphate:Na+ symporter
MASDILTLLGGIGLFLFGMRTMTAALRQIGSRGTRRFLARFTTTPLAGVATGAVATAAIQSSSAVVMTVIGFVGGGLLTFPQALGVILGANIGSTVTGWIVAILGLKFNLGTLALPLTLLGTLIAVLSHGQREQTGLSLAGFGVMFVGLDMMQSAAVAVGPMISSMLVPADGLTGRLLLVLVGVGVTLIVQSSSAGIAATLVLLAGGSVDMLQAALLVIGMDVGTTVKSLIATAGGSRDMRRTAIAHVGFNVVTATVAFVLVGLTPYLSQALGGDEATALVAFHTLFNVAGVLVVMPVATPFARLIERIFPGVTGRLPEPLDRTLLAEPRVALDAAGASASRLSTVLFGHVAQLMHGSNPGDLTDDLHHALEDLEEFLTDIPLPAGGAGPRNRLSAMLHLIDHLHRLSHRSTQAGRLEVLRQDRTLLRPARALAAALERAAAAPGDPRLARRLGRLHDLITARTARIRRAALLREHVGLVGPRDVFDLTDALRWTERVCRHAERIVYYGAVAAEEEPTREAARREAALPER